MDASAAPLPLQGWTVLCLRPAAEAGGLRRRLARAGARLCCLAPWRIEPLPVDAALASALAAPVLLATSPTAVRCAARLAPIGRFAGKALAVGSGTARALRRAGVAGVQTPPRMHSEALLALPALAAPVEVGLLTGEGGRDLLAPTLVARGARVHRVDLYRRAPRPLPAHTADRLRALPAPLALLLSSAEALQRVAAAPGVALALRRFVPVYASPRLRDAGRALGLADGVLADSATATDLIAALCRHAKAASFR